ncbi:Conserved_hypothetical protein [Hexamita inflata]|uniref:Uncharacterized protein n=1 Tax=Hexamita inflata TaxID=28002 RepID=A0AA86R663_9EUKA|nr:Conserved hypothetical protein [Hexamita inflata]
MDAQSSIRSGGSSMSCMTEQEQLQQHIVLDNPLKLMIRIVTLPVIQQILFYCVKIYYIGTVVYYQGIPVAKLIAIADPLIDLVCATIPQALLTGNYDQIQKLLFKRQQVASNLCYTYTFVVYLVLQLLVTLVIGLNSSSIISGLNLDAAQVQYLRLNICLSVISHGMMNFVRNSLMLEGNFLGASNIMFSLCFVIALTIYYAINKLSKYVTALALIYTGSSFAGAIFYQVSYFKKNSETQLKIMIQSLNPFRGKLILLILKNFMRAFVQKAFEPVIAIVTMIAYNQWTQEGRPFANVGIIVFYLYRQLSGISNSINDASESFLEMYFHSNCQVNNVTKIYQAFFGNHSVVLLCNILLSGLSQWISNFSIEVVFPSGALDSESYQMVQQIKNTVRLCAVTGIVNSSNAFVFTLARAQHKHALIIGFQAIQILYIAAICIMSFVVKTVYNYSDMYLTGLLMQGISSYMLYAVNVKKLNEVRGLQVQAEEPLPAFPDLIAPVMPDENIIEKNLSAPNISSQPTSNEGKKSTHDKSQSQEQKSASIFLNMPKINTSTTDKQYSSNSKDNNSKSELIQNSKDKNDEKEVSNFSK